MYQLECRLEWAAYHASVGRLTSLVFGVNMMSGINITSLIVAIVGAVIVVAVYRLIRGRKVV